MLHFHCVTAVAAAIAVAATAAAVAAVAVAVDTAAAINSSNVGRVMRLLWVRCAPSTVLILRQDTSTIDGVCGRSNLAKVAILVNAITAEFNRGWRTSR